MSSSTLRNRVRSAVEPTSISISPKQPKSAGLDRIPSAPLDSPSLASVISSLPSSSDDSASEGDNDGVTSNSGVELVKEQAFVDPFPNFLWMTMEEPHRSRRMAILKAHPEVSQYYHDK